MRVAIDARPLGSGDSVRGIGVYTRELLGAFKKIGKEVVVLDKGYAGASEKFDLVHLTSFNPFTVSVPFTKPKGTKFVLTIYDLIPLIYPKNYPSGIRGGLKLALNKHLIKRNIDAVLTISETSKKDICRFFGIDPKIVHVVRLAPRSIFRKLEIENSLKIENWKLKTVKRSDLPDRFALYVGDVNYNKNIPVLVEACRMAKVTLVFAGKQAVEIENMNLDPAELRHLKGLDWTGVIRLGFVPDDELAAIYNLAALYIQPSLYEGFGLPVLEAMACGTPVVAAKTQALVEIVEGAALFADSKNVKEFADAIRSVIDDRNAAAGLSKQGLTKAKEFSWEKTARETYNLYEKI